MSALRTVLGGVGEGMAPDGTMIRVRVRLTLDLLLTLVISVLAIGLVVSYQVLRHLPGSWRERLLGDSTEQE